MAATAWRGMARHDELQMGILEVVMVHVRWRSSPASNDDIVGGATTMLLVVQRRWLAAAPSISVGMRA
jgi:hypothetical protein